MPINLYKQISYGMSKPRYLTKSRFKLANECTVKLYYTGKPDIYPDTKLKDGFLAALAEGGYQVGELAKLYFPGGKDINSLDYEESLDQTNQLLQNESAVIYEAAIRYKNLFIRADVLVKKGSQLSLFEVKAKSFDPTAIPSPFLTKRDQVISSEWKPYLYDVAFQKYVIQNAYPEMKVESFLMLADKTAICEIDQLNQMFRVAKGVNNRKYVKISPVIDEAGLGEQILCKVNVDDFCEMIFQGRDANAKQALSFEQRIQQYSDFYSRDKKLLQEPQVSARCAKCEFRASSDEEAAGMRSGFKECWKDALGWCDSDFDQPNVLDIWNFKHKDELIAVGKIKLNTIDEDDIRIKKDNKPGLSHSERQWLQVKKAAVEDDSPWVDLQGLRQEMNTWQFPLHFIDFETTMVALPFNKGRKPYEAIAFQFSHHIVNVDGSVEYKGQYLNTDRGVFPNYDFLRALREELSDDQGTVFRYAAHENTFLNHIYRQLHIDESDVPDRNELLGFIQSITHSTKGSPDEWVGSRDMVDMCQLVKRYYYDPLTNGSNSIKYVLPAVLNRSSYLHQKYTDPIYGSKDGIPSKNFQDWSWIKKENNKVVDPYKLLPKIFQDADELDLEILSSDDEIREGGAAMTAYARLQFEEMSEYERDEIRRALLQYCELDTFAMVMIYEAWREW